MDNQRWNLRNVPFELTIRSTTAVICQPISDSKEIKAPEIIEINNVGSATGFVSNYKIHNLYRLYQTIIFKN